MFSEAPGQSHFRFNCSSETEQVVNLRDVKIEKLELRFIEEQNTKELFEKYSYNYKCNRGF